ncbi:MAG: response regulator transcription factor [Bacteroidetes bacterium]|nr:response regulator transcription factor [Bacteroidota bacterium]
MRIPVGIVEDHKEFRQSLSFLLSSSGDFDVVWAFDSAEAALKRSTDVSVILLDINLPQMSGIDAIAPLKAKHPPSHIVMLTILEDDTNVVRAIQNGADGYVLKKTSPPKIMEAIRQVYEGGSPLTPSVAKQLLGIFKNIAPPAGSDYNLTAREKEILNMLVGGFSTNLIAGTLFISEETVRNHFRHIYEKLQVHTKSQAVAKAIRENLL